ncbi:MAG TPA: hypothetical protein VMW56_01280 [Candidatus Margulisiibacteriota bacterium]|nr:hypothetical protein [Candidatus Margulisiibacteriota bacterium]
MKSVFFWSEEHAREQRRLRGGARGLYLALKQAAFVTPLLQGPLFAFPRRD